MDVRWSDDSEGRSLGVGHVAPRRPLTARQREVLTLLANGRTVNQAASELGVSPAAVWNNAVYAEGRLRANGREHAIAIAIATGEIDAPEERLQELLQPLFADLGGLRGESGQPFFPTEDARESLTESLTFRAPEA